MSTSIGVSDSEIENLLKAVAEDEGIRNFKINVTEGAMKGDGYLGIIKSAQITGVDHTNKPKVLNLIVKCANNSDALREKIRIKDIFTKEIHMYQTVFPAYKQLEEENGILPLTRFAPKLYKAETKNKAEALAMENLRTLGYKLFEKTLAMDAEHVTLVMRQYGRFHALSLALKYRHPEKFEKLALPIKDLGSLFTEEDSFAAGLVDQCKKCMGALDPVKDKHTWTVCEAFIDELPNMIRSARKLLECEDSVILHGDCWINNIMFKYDENNKPIAADFIDYQITRLGSPAMDLTYFFYACGSKEVIVNWEHYMKIYYDALADHLRKLQCDPDKVFAYKTLQEHWKKYAKWGLFSSLIVIHLVLTDNQQTEDFASLADAGKDVVQVFNCKLPNPDKYYERVRPILLHVVECSFLETPV